MMMHKQSDCGTSFYFFPVWGLHADIWKIHSDKTLKLGREKKEKKSPEQDFCYRLLEVIIILY